MRKKSLEWLVFFLGMFIMSLGIVQLLKADFGMAPWNVLEVGLYYHIGLTIGIWSQLMGVGLVVLTVWLTKRIPGWGTLLNMIFVGLFIDLIMFLHIIPDVASMTMRTIYFFGGIFCLTFGMGMYISPGLGEGPRDGITLALSQRLNRSVRTVRTAMEATVLLAGWLLGGPVGWGTIAITLLTGYLMQFFIQCWKRWLQRIRGRGEGYEDFNERPIRADDYDGVIAEVRGRPDFLEKNCRET